MRGVKHLDFGISGIQILLNLVVLNGKPSLGYCFVEVALFILLWFCPSALQIKQRCIIV